MRKFILISFILLLTAPAEEYTIDTTELKEGIRVEKRTGKPISGLFTGKYASGSPQLVTHFKEGVREGLKSMFYENGQLKYGKEKGVR